MAKISITKFADVSKTSNGSLLCATTPFISTEDFTASSVSAQSSEFESNTLFVRVVSDTDVRVVFGNNPTATTSSMPIKAGLPEYFGVSAGLKMAAIEG